MSARLLRSDSGYSAEKLYSLFRKQSPDVVDSVALADIENMFSMPGFEVDRQLCQGLDVYYRAETRRLIRSPDSDNELRAFLDHIEHQDAIDGFNQVQSPQGIKYSTKWRCLGELVEDQMEVYESISAAKQLRRRHVPEILSYLNNHQGQEVKQKDICESLRISKTHLSGLLGPMVELGWVQRKRVGVSNHLSLTHKGRADFQAHLDDVQKQYAAMAKHTATPLPPLSLDKKTADNVEPAT